MQAPLKNPNDIKIFILYLMRNVGYPLDFNNINDIVVQDGFVNYFDFAECFADLLDKENVEEIKEEGKEPLYRVTERGKAVADNLQSELMLMIREKSLKSALKLLSFQKRGWKVRYRAKERNDGRFDFVCNITEGEEEIFHVSLIVDNKKQLDRIKYNIDEKPEHVYRGFLSILSGEPNYLID